MLSGLAAARASTARTDSARPTRRRTRTNPAGRRRRSRAIYLLLRPGGAKGNAAALGNDRLRAGGASGSPGRDSLEKDEGGQWGRLQFRAPTGRRAAKAPCRG